eukprot:TRINITY_DN953_c0_g1_i2.p1 TRINITY_DN953_c0_g1~~TRINITY_DN953_c0_g1_i2.p1  ORF type:complete len:192 (-),score=35.06 TRINITY_DN953_c0_g1_i2:527-1102(-)
MISKLSSVFRQNSQRIQSNGHGVKRRPIGCKGNLEVNSSFVVQWKRFATNVPEKTKTKLNINKPNNEEADSNDVIEFQKPYQPPPKITMEEYFPHLAFEKQVMKERALKQKFIEDSMTPHEEEDHDHDHHHDEKHGDSHHPVGHHDANKHHDSHDHHSDLHHHDGHGNYEHEPHGDLDHPDLEAQRKPGYV